MRILCKNVYFCKFVSVDFPGLADFGAVAAWCHTAQISLVVVGPEDPLAAGFVDTLTEKGK